MLHIYDNRIIKLLLAGCLSIGLLAGNAAAQSSERGAKITVVVKDQLGGVVKDAEVVLQADEKKDRKALSDNSGIAEFSALPDGVYRITITSKDFDKYTGENLVVENGRDVAAEIVLNISPVKSEVDVDETDFNNTDPENFGGTRTLTQNEIDALPDDPEELERILKQMAGGNGNQQPISVNGFSESALPPKQAIRKIVFHQNIFSAKYDSLIGDGIEIFTKAGLEKFSGGVGFSFGDSRLNASNAFSGFRVPAQSRSLNANLQGPIIPRKASFIAYFYRTQSNTESLVNSTVLNSALQPEEFRGTFPVSTSRTYFDARLDFDITQNHKLYLSLKYNPINSENSGINLNRLPSRAYDTRNATTTFQLAETSIINKSVVAQTRFQFVNAKLKRDSRNDGVVTEVQDAFSDGGAQIDSSNLSRKFELASDVTWQMNSYTLYFGGRLRGISIRDNSTGGFGGRYIFSGRIAPELDAADNPVLDENGNVINTLITSLESYRRTLLFRSLGYNGSQIRTLGGGANQFLIEGGDPEARVNQFDVGLYVQNSLKLRKDLSLSFGLRYENQTNIDSNFNLAPRVGLIWAPGTDKKSKSALASLPRISAGFGVFYDRIGEQLTLDASRSESRFQYIVDNAAILDLFPNVPSLDLLGDFAQSRIRRAMDEKAQAPRRLFFSLNMEKRLPFGMLFFVSTDFSRTSRVLRTTNVNAPLAGTYLPDNPGAGNFPLGREAGTIYRTESSGVVKHKVLYASLKIPKFKLANLQIDYSLNRKKDNLVYGSGSPVDPYDFSGEFAAADDDVRHRLSIISVSTLPLGIRLTNVLGILSGFPYNIVTGRDTNGDGFFLERPALANDLNADGLIRTPLGTFDASPSPTDAIIPRNYGRGPGTFTLDTLVMKQFKLFRKNQTDAGKYTLNLSVRANNILNVVNRDNPIGNISSPNFLRSIYYAPARGGLFSPPAPRRLSFDVRFNF